MSNSPINPDSTDLDRLHSAVKREKADLPAGSEPAPVWVIFLGFIAAILAGGQMGTFTGYGLESTPNLGSVVDPRQSGGAAVQLTPMELAMKKGEQNFAVCAGCHQASGAGQPGLYPSLVGSDWVTAGSERTIRVILHGLNGPLTISGAPFVSSLPTGMPGQGAGMDDVSIASVVTYIRNSWGNKGGLVTSDMVAKVRDKEKSRSSQWTMAELEPFAKAEVPGAPGADTPPAK